MDGMDIREIQEPEKHQPLCVVAQVPAVSVHEEPLYVPTSHAPSAALHQLLSAEPTHSGVVVTNWREVHGPVVAEHGLVLIFALAKRIPQAQCSPDRESHRKTLAPSLRVGPR
jgi:phosphoglycerate dehydrogenase-like enzyme